MNTFGQYVNSALKSLGQTKEFVRSSTTQHAIKLKKWHWDISNVELLLLIAVISIPLAGFLVTFNIPQSLRSALGVVYGGFIAYSLGASLGISWLLKIWKNQAEKNQLGTDFKTKVDFDNLNRTMSITEKVETIDLCQSAGAAPECITQLYALTSDNIPFAWWDTLRTAAQTEMDNQAEQQKQHNEVLQYEENKRRAYEKIQAHTNPILDVEQLETPHCNHAQTISVKL